MGDRGCQIKGGRFRDNYAGSSCRTTSAIGHGDTIGADNQVSDIERLRINSTAAACTTASAGPVITKIGGIASRDSDSDLTI